MISTNDAGVYLGCALVGHGIARISRAMAEPYINSGRLVEIMTEWQTDELPISPVGQGAGVRELGC